MYPLKQFWETTFFLCVILCYGQSMVSLFSSKFGDGHVPASGTDMTIPHSHIVTFWPLWMHQTLETSHRRDQRRAKTSSSGVFEGHRVNWPIFVCWRLDLVIYPHCEATGFENQRNIWFKRGVLAWFHQGSEFSRIQWKLMETIFLEPASWERIDWW
jgi:hypothetical protein